MLSGSGLVCFNKQLIIIAPSFYDHTNKAGQIYFVQKYIGPVIITLTLYSEEKKVNGCPEVGNHLFFLIVNFGYTFISTYKTMKFAAKLIFILFQMVKLSNIIA